ncbi:2OG-Fe(II) oxygenase [Limnobacter sp.]|uniref:2OG-Fe(II) oxygenase n=1 Tax=Limnobacter sp. TaxID=2003368 RepID=UPI002FDF95E5
MSSIQSFPCFTVLFDAIANDLREHGYSIQDKALPQEWIDGLLRDMRTLGAGQLKPAGVGRAQQHVANASIRRDAISWIESTEGAQGQWLAFSAQLQRHLNRSLMLGLFSFESHFAHYAPGAFYKTHVDAFKGQANRVLSVVLYLNPAWVCADGGEMVLYSDTAPGTVLCKVSPNAGTLAVFLSEDFPHEVLPALRDRYSIAGWYRVNTSNTGRVDPPA